MKIIYSVILVSAVLVLVGSGLVFAMSCCADTGHEGHGNMPQTKSAAVDAGNKICPVTGEEIDEATKATYEYEGKVYNFCCSMCIDEFKKEPQKYIDKVNQELQATKGTE